MSSPPSRPRGPVRVVDYPTEQRPPERDESAGASTRLQSVWHRFRANRLALLGLGLLAVITLVTVFARPVDVSLWGSHLTLQPFAIAPHPPGELHVGQPHEGPSLTHPFGTDWAGRDLFSRVLVGGRLSVGIGILATLLALGIGVPLGAVAGYVGGWVDEGLMRLVDVLYAFPFLVLAIALVAIVGQGFWQIVAALTAVGWVSYARLLRGEVLAVTEREYVLAARAIGGSDRTILLRHVLPNSIGPVIVQATLTIGAVVLSVAALGFLGLGLEPGSAEWGAMLSRSRGTLMQGHWHVTVFPGLAIFLFVMAINLVGDGLSDALDPHDRTERGRMR